MLRILNIAFVSFLLMAGLSANAQNMYYHSELEEFAFNQCEKADADFHVLALFLALDSSLTLDDYYRFRNELLAQNEFHRGHRSPQATVGFIARKFLKHYTHDAEMPELYASQQFNCVSGSALIAYIFQLNGFSCEIRELPHHVFIIAHKGNKEFVIESTDSLYTIQRMKSRHLERYIQDTLDQSEYLHSGLFNESEINISVNKEIDLCQLAGLHYYNRAVKLANEGEWQNAMYILQKAYHLYPSKRIALFTDYVAYRKDLKERRLKISRAGF